VFRGISGETGNKEAPFRPRLYGRAGELGMLEQILRGARDGRSGVIVVRGEPGIGKSALLGQLVSEASGFRVVRAVGVESEMELPFAGLHQLCAPMLGLLDSLAEPQRRALSIAFGLITGENPEPFLVSLAALSLLSAAADEQPLLCVVDDAHWLDQASAQVLGFVGRRLLAEPIALVFAARDSRSPSGHLAGLPALSLGGLDDESAAALLGTVMPGPIDESVRERIIEETNGNPLACLSCAAAWDRRTWPAGSRFPMPETCPRASRISTSFGFGSCPRRPSSWSCSPPLTWLGKPHWCTGQLRHWD
jgi:hypothetical protein